MKTTILVADDEMHIANSISYALTREDYEVYTAYDGKEAMNLFTEHCPDILILDVMMPYHNGFDICKMVTQVRSVGIIMLTAKAELVDKVLGLELGADDYITKPFDMPEVIARVRSLSRRITKSNLTQTVKNIIQIENLSINLDERLVKINDSNIYLKPKEFDLLAFLIQNINIAFSREKILDKVWGLDYFGGTRTIDIHVQRIRKKLGSYGTLIKTVPKFGYKAVRSCDEN
ncbi:response regulator transcription factor [Clostridiaceae bacterium M8S5]|nr:response regulator transcription factor [Clostridiaceae bacterium M8S5]